MSDRSAPVLTAIAVMTMAVISGCAGSPEPAPPAITPPATERDNSVVTEVAGNGESGPDLGIAHVTPAAPVIDVSVPRPEIEFNAAFEAGRVDPGFFVAAPESEPDFAMQLDEPELPSAGVPDPTGDAGSTTGLTITADLEPIAESGPAEASEPPAEPEPPAESRPPAEPEPAGDSAPWGEDDPVDSAAVAALRPPRPERAPEPAEETGSGDAPEPATPEVVVGPTVSGVPEFPERTRSDSPSVSPGREPVQGREPAGERTPSQEREPAGERTPSQEREPAGERPGAETEAAVPFVAAPRASGPRFTETPETTRNTRSVPAASEIEVRLPGVSWLFLGSEPPVTFLGRETDPDADETLFRFRVTEAAQLRFESQNLASGDRTRHEETVEITAGDPENPTPAVRTAEGDRSARSGQTTETPRRSDDNSTDEVTPPTDGNTGSDGADELTYLDYLHDVEQPFDPDHHASIVTAITEGGETLLDVSPAVLVSYADRVRDQGNPEAAQDVLQAMREFSRMQSDEVLYRLARLAETDGPTRDLRRARELYSQLVDRYPFSVHYRDSEERIRFLNRHFFHIR